MTNYVVLWSQVSQVISDFLARVFTANENDTLKWRTVKHVKNDKKAQKNKHSLVTTMNFASLLHLSNIPRQLRLSISQQLVVPKTKINLGLE